MHVPGHRTNAEIKIAPVLPLAKLKGQLLIKILTKDRSLTGHQSDIDYHLIVTKSD